MNEVWHHHEVRKRELPQVEVITQKALEMHTYFDEEIWKKNPDAHIFKDGVETELAPSYHNDKHIAAVLGCVSAVFKNSFTDDVFALQTALTDWNKNQDINNQVSLSDLETAFILAFATHDLGNITTDTNCVDVDYDDISKCLNYSNTYISTPVEVEERSAQIAKKMIEKSFTNNFSFVKKISSLVEHLIMQTVYDPNQTTSEQPFWLAMQTIDQIGQSFFTKASRTEACAGLLNEIWVGFHGGKNNQIMLNLDPFIRFTEVRLQKLFPDITTQERVIQLFQNGNTNITIQKIMCLDKIDSVLLTRHRAAHFPEDIIKLMQLVN